MGKNEITNFVRHAKNRNWEIPWPIHGINYVCGFIAPLAAGTMLGVAAERGSFLLVGLLLGGAISYLNMWFIERLVEPWITKNQLALSEGMPRVILNFAVFVWVVAVSCASMLAPIAIFGIESLERASH